ncbi:alkaline phosphatase family protein [Motilibacter sp. E257]|uniref:Alkaline phosphatase family protein n=1 Tax=Motilibacter deserti TaxID=2714956 RepID=A0ABX0GW07_9ACTN|nr:alkaline phosphatase family protein [Motilibacter deserti]
MSDVLPSVLAGLGVPDAVDTLGLGPQRRVCVLLVDGLGDELLAGAAAHAPFLTGLRERGRTLQAGFPSTTATSVSSLGTGLPPGAHGLVGLNVAIPDPERAGSRRLLSLLRWRDEADPRAWQPEPTAFERAAAAGVDCSVVVSRSFRGSGLTEAALRGATLRAAETAGERVMAAVQALEAAPRSLVYAYYGDLDATGHAAGAASQAWLLQLEHVDRLAEQIAERLPAGTSLLVTADHGMVDVDRGCSVDVDTTPELRDGVALLGGEARARHVYTEPGAAQDVCATWAEVLGDAAWVLSGEEAIARGWFGDVHPRVRPLIGDVVAAARGRSAVLASAQDPVEARLVGLHGSLTSAEQTVPLLPVLAG